MNERTVQPSALPAEYAERVSDHMDFEDRLAWERARRRFQSGGRPMPKVQHVKIEPGRHVLVVDGTRGPVAYGGAPAYHPAGWIFWPTDAYNPPPGMTGKLLRVSDVPMEEIKVAEPAGMAEAWKLLSETNLALTDEALARWPEAK